MIRFVLSTDGSQTRTGWWIDDISITNVDVPETCATGSACEDNPFVDVDPEGPITECSLDSPLLTANLSSGNGPYVRSNDFSFNELVSATGSSPVVCRHIVFKNEAGIAVWGVTPGP